MSLFNELKRRNVFRVGIAYVVASWVFLQVADLVLDAINAPDWVLQTLMLLIGLGFIAALIIAWAYEITPEGIKRDRDVTPEDSISHDTANRLNRITIGLVLAALVIIVIDRLVPERQSEHPAAPTPAQVQPEEPGSTNTAMPVVAQASDTDPAAAPAEKSVAVLPFVNMSSDPEQEYFSDGISEEILNVLTRIPNLKVAARTSSFQFKGQNQDIADIARQLKVNHILEGSVRKAGDQLRITAQLIEAGSGYHLWSDTFDRKLEDVFAIQDEIANAIAGELRARLSEQPLETSTPVDMQAYELYLKGRSLVATRRGEELLESIGVLKAALQVAPDYAPAMATLAKAYVVIPWFSAQIPTGTAREEARNWASQALQLEPDNTEALSVMGIVYNEADLDPAKALEVLEAAVRADPGSVVAQNFLGDIYTRIADFDKALMHESKAAELDPLGPVQLTDLANVYVMLGAYDKVEELAYRALELDPEFSHALMHLADLYFIQADVQAHESIAQRVENTPGWNSTFKSRVQVQLMLLRGEYSQATAALKLQAEQARRGERGAVVGIAFQAVIAGNFDLAGEMLLRALDNGDGTWNVPVWVRLPEQAPDSEPWQAFWRQPGPARYAELRRRNGLKVETPMPTLGTRP